MLIAIEGIDGSGKGTQATRLQQRLEKSGRRTALISFPRYSQTNFGQAIGWFLNGRFGELSQVDPHLAATLYAADRFESRGFLADMLAKHEVVVSDRYVASNIAHQGARCQGDARQTLQAWINRIEFEVFQLPVADLNILLDVPAETAQMLIARKAQRDYTDRKADLQEADAEYLANVRDAYHQIASGSNWETVSLMNGDQLLSIDEVADRVWAVVDRRLNG